MKKSTATSRAEVDNQTVERSHVGLYEADRGGSSSVSVDAPHRNFTEAVSISNQHLEEVNSCYDLGSRMTASIGSAKLASDGDEFGKELQCTADSRKVFAQPRPDDPSSSSFIQDNNVDAGAQKFVSLQALSDSRHEPSRSFGATESLPDAKEKEEKKKDKEKKRKRDDHKGHQDDPEYKERKRLKKEKKKKEKEMAKLMSEAKTFSLNEQAKASSVELTNKKDQVKIQSATVELNRNETSGSKVVLTGVESRPEAAKAAPSAAPKFRIKIKNRTLNQS
ncbi:hypothetical protein TIFTF001_027031 [Ficus carica]|uniref:Uncharacterized protein n=1 Tax=Ficus carica TaxID=3494 RepID=A0AA88IUF4_FICCA|nr:hypothetical protein TIFTF001_027031 [Ficus carica]